MNFIDLQRQYNLYKKDIDHAIQEVLNSSRYVFGSQIDELENVLAQFVGTRSAVACGSGSDAIQLALMALDLKPGDEIITTPFTFIATAEIPVLLGLKPVFADIDDKTYNIDPKAIEKLITKKTKAIMPVSIFGQVAEMDEIIAIAKKHDLFIIEDAAQSFGAEYKKSKSCSFGDIGVTSFFPAKPLGCYGEGGMAFTNNEELAAAMKSLRNHGQGDKYQHKLVGFNGRLDTIQAAILLAKFKYYENEIELRQKAADFYTKKLAGAVLTPFIREYNKSVYAQYSIQVPDRNKMLDVLQKEQIPAAVHYPLPLHLQPCFKFLGYQEGSFPIAESVCGKILSLPMFPQITEEEQNLVIAAVLAGLK
jgi:UDP-2-acetamido-2-deoxy-ribo-hexuluronate aminotransferase